MLLRKSALLLGLSAGVMGLTPVVWGQEQPIVEVPNSRNSVQGEINASGVNVRSGPADSYYPTMQLSKGERVTVVGHRFDWLKIVPPQGSFSYVAKIYVDREGQSASGTINRDDVLVRAGSTLSPMKAQAQTKLAKGSSVEILGESDEYYKVKPPVGAYLYVKKDFVSMVNPAGAAAAVAATPAAAGGITAASTTEPAAGAAAMETGAAGIGAAAGQGTSSDLVEVTPTTKKPMHTTHKAEKAADAKADADVKPADVDQEAEAEFRKLEARFNQSKELPLEDQPIADMLKGYQELQDNSKLSATSRRMAAFRVKYLTAVEAQQADLVKAKQEAANFSAQQAELEAQRKQIEDRLKQTGVAVYQAVGQLQVSGVQKDGQPLLRLVDPADGHTLVYIRTSDAKLRGMVGKFVGVRGEVAKDDRLRVDYIEPNEMEQIDPGRVFKGVTAKIYPPSSLRGSATESSK